MKLPALPPRVFSITVATVIFAEWSCLGYYFPPVAAFREGLVTDFSSHWSPFLLSIVMSFHLSWCIPVGVLLAAAVIVKDWWCSPLVAGRINLAVFCTGLLIWIICIFVVFAPVRFSPPRSANEHSMTEPEITLPNNKGYSGGEKRVSDYAHCLNKPG